MQLHKSWHYKSLFNCLREEINVLSPSWCPMKCKCNVLEIEHTKQAKILLQMLNMCNVVQSLHILCKKNITGQMLVAFAIFPFDQPGLHCCFSTSFAETCIYCVWVKLHSFKYCPPSSPYLQLSWSQLSEEHHMVWVVCRENEEFHMHTPHKCQS